MRPEPLTRRAVTATVATAALLVTWAGTAAAAGFGPMPPPNPALATASSATMHGDSESSDTTPFPGPGSGRVHSRFTELGSACPTILAGSDGMPQALCTTVLGRTPTVHLLDPDTGASLASLSLRKGNLLGGVYAYLDAANRMVTVDGSGDLLRVAHDRHGPHGSLRLYVASRTPIQQAVSGHCGGGDCDGVASLMPGYRGRVWFATQHAVVGVVDANGTARTVALPDGEHVDNSISTGPTSTAVVTDHAMYLLTAGNDGVPRIAWRRPYDRGTARKPGQLSWGSGASPTFFGPRHGSEYLAITDNAEPREHLVVYDTRDADRVCSLPVTDGTELSPIGSGRSLFVASTYGYPYPAVPGDAGPSEPASAPFTGGMARIDVRADGSGCEVVWRNDVRSAAVPRLSTSSGLLYTVSREPLLGSGSRTGVLDRYSYTTVDAETGAVRAEQQIGVGFPADTLQMVGTITPGNVLYQGTVTGLFRIEAR